LGGNPVFGYIDENNNIILSGNLADGTYTAKYEMEDGSTVDIGELVLDKNVYYSVTNTLTNCVSDNSTVQAIGGQNYSAVISADNGYELTSVVVTMGGTNISSSAVSGGTISIAEVTGDIVITAVAEKVVVITNFLEPNTDNTTDWNIWCNNARIGSDGAYRSSTTQDATNYISVQNGDIIHINQGRMINGQIIGLYNTSKATVSAGSTTDLSNGGHISDATGINSTTLDAQFTIANASVAFIRFTLNRSSFSVADGEIVVNIERNGEYL